MTKSYAKIKLDKKAITFLQDTVSDLKYEIDRLQQYCLDSKNRELDGRVAKFREVTMEMIAIIANIEENLQFKVNCMIADFLNKVYADLASLEQGISVLYTEAQGGKRLITSEMPF
jgi:hypothetical protein